MRERCGVIAAVSYNGSDIAYTLVNGLRALQHRGQESWGVALGGCWLFKRPGLVSECLEEFRRSLPETDKSRGIGHVRYSTIGGPENIQPIDIGGLFRIAQNGTIANYQTLIKDVGYKPDSHPSDTLIAGLKLKQILHSSNWDWVDAFTKLSKILSGSYCFVIERNDGVVIAARDPYGYRPLCIGYREEDETFIIASESCALDVVGARLIRDVRPGELVILGRDGPEYVEFEKPRAKHACAFEYTYFANPNSVIDGVSVYKVRKTIGALLAEKYRIEGDVVIPIPESARPAALGYAEKLGITFEEGLLKDRYSRKGGWRSFIEPSRESRVEINRWIMPVKSIIDNKDVILVDDSIVRGVSSAEVIKAVKRAGAKKVNLVVTFPPIAYPCYMGMDFPEREELIAYRASRGARLSIEDVAGRVSKLIGADKVVYSDPGTLAKAIGKELGELCFSCHTGDYSALRELPVIATRKSLKGED